jgi:predicted MPP superfamily phosphohydrolase
VIRQNLGESLRNIKSQFGVFAITGNHEYIGGAEEACSYLTEHKVTMLRDQSLKVADSFFLVGREDQSSSRFPPYNRRKDLAELMESVDKKYPVILMDHQPFELNEAAGQGIDLQISGHTHYGQLWPINYIVNGIYELAWGYRRIAGTQYYVSDGVGTWGPPVRIGNRPEIVNIEIQFKKMTN